MSRGSIQVPGLLTNSAVSMPSSQLDGLRGTKPLSCLSFYKRRRFKGNRLFIPFNLRPRHWLDLLAFATLHGRRDFSVWSPCSFERLFVVRSEGKAFAFPGRIVLQIMPLRTKSSNVLEG